MSSTSNKKKEKKKQYDHCITVCKAVFQVVLRLMDSIFWTRELASSAQWLHSCWASQQLSRRFIPGFWSDFYPAPDPLLVVPFFTNCYNRCTFISPPPQPSSSAASVVVTSLQCTIQSDFFCATLFIVDLLCFGGGPSEGVVTAVNMVDFRFFSTNSQPTPAWFIIFVIFCDCCQLPTSMIARDKVRLGLALGGPAG